jgi:LPXTG-motif cell wall-anchored protein
LPEYATVTPSNEAGDSLPAAHTWKEYVPGDEDTFTEAEVARIGSMLYKSTDKTDRIASCWYTGSDTFFTVTVDVGSESKIVSLYNYDYDENGRQIQISAKDEAGTVLVAPIDVTEFQKGIYSRFQITGKVTFTIEYIDSTVVAANGVLSAIFFDPDPSLEIQVETVEETPAETGTAPTAPVTDAPAANEAAEVTVQVPQTGDAGIYMLLVMLAVSLSAIVFLKKRAK